MAVVQGSSVRALAGAATWQVGLCVTLIHVGIGWAGWTWLRVPDLRQPQIQWVESVPAPPPLSPSAVAPAPAKPSVPGGAPTLAAPQRAAEAPVLPPSPVPEPTRGAAQASLTQVLPMAPAGSAAALPRTDPHPGASQVSAPGPAPSLPLSLPSERASYLNNPPPIYPAISRRLGEQGRVVIRVYIDERGEPIEADWAQRSGYSRLDQAAMNAVMAWRYVPAKRGEVPVAMWFNVPITFDLKQHKD